jgi:energy-converting hydrogenase Eha subunit A
MFRYRVALILCILVGLAVALPAQAQERPIVTELTIGLSAQGRPITALRIGSGPRKLALIGDTHGFPEANTFELSQQLADYFRAPPELDFIHMNRSGGIGKRVRQAVE